MEGVFPNELSLQQVRVARPFSAVLAALRPLGVPWHITKLPREMARGAVLLAPGPGPHPVTEFGNLPPSHLHGWGLWGHSG